MKKTILSFIFFLSCLFSKANKIDSLQTDDNVLHFIKPILQKEFKIDQLDLSFSQQDNAACNNLSPNQSLRKWSKADFNNDGLTDLFLNIYQANEHPIVLVIIATNADNYKIINLNRLRSGCEFGYTEKYGEIPMIILSRKDKNAVITDSVQYENLVGDFISIKKIHAPFSIEKIEFSTDHCFGSCPIFSLSIDSKGIADYDAIEYNPQQGKFKATLSAATKDSLFQLLNDIDFPNLKNEYAVSWTDQQTGILKITYDNGKIKSISDYGMKGNFSLAALYKMLLSLRDTQQWESNH